MQGPLMFVCGKRFFWGFDGEHSLAGYKILGSDFLPVILRLLVRGRLAL